jgi:hypothetical protein
MYCSLSGVITLLAELRLAQLALDPNNSPAWEVPEQERRPSTKMPLFVRAQPVYKSQHQTEVRGRIVYAVFIILLCKACTCVIELWHSQDL